MYISSNTGYTSELRPLQSQISVTDSVLERSVSVAMAINTAGSVLILLTILFLSMLLFTSYAVSSQPTCWPHSRTDPGTKFNHSCV